MDTTKLQTIYENTTGTERGVQKSTQQTVGGKIDSIIEISKDTKTFWSKIKQLKGNNTTHTNYLHDNDGNRHHTDAEKCRVMESTWRNIFRITEEEEASFDTFHSEHIDTYINIQNPRIQPYDKTDITRSDNGCFYTRPIDNEEIKRHIRRIKIKHQALLE